MMYSSNPNPQYLHFATPLPPPPVPAKYDDQQPTTEIPVSSSTYDHADSFSGNLLVSPSPSPFPILKKTRLPWSTGVFDCFSDTRNCCVTCWCPCITFGRVAEIVDKGSTSCGASGAIYTLMCCVIWCPCFYSCFYRTKMRQQHLLLESPCNDCLLHCCCTPCALCQEYRELQNRGFDMKIGWHGNVEKRNRAVEMTVNSAPVVDDGMSRE